VATKSEKCVVFPQNTHFRYCLVTIHIVSLSC
jgi:hypothetical protein